MKDLREDLNRLKQVETSEASVKAKQLGLNYVGFGRYEDSRTGQVTHIISNNKLVPFQRAVKTNTFKATGMDDVGNYNEFVQPEVQQLHQALIANYSPDKYKDDELNAIYAYTNGGYLDINNRLAELPPGVPAKKIEPTSPEDTIVDVVNSLDSMLRKSRAPFDFLGYIKLGPDYNVQDIVPGRKMVLKTYKDTSINMATVLNSSDNSVKSPAGRNMAVLFQVLVKKNSRGMYISDYSATPDDMEFLLPRGTVLEVMNGPQNLVGSNAVTQDMNLEIVYFDVVAKT